MGGRMPATVSSTAMRAVFSISAFPMLLSMTDRTVGTTYVSSKADASLLAKT